MYRIVHPLLVSLCLCLSALAMPLTPCPDCARPVSPRAVFCPFCGCPGDAIAESAQSGGQAAARRPDRLIRISADAMHGFAFPVEMADGLFAVAPLDFLLRAETLSLSFASTNAPISYAMPEVAVDASFVRFPITETNLAYWCAAPLESPATSYADISAAFEISFGAEPTVRSLAAVSSATNLVAFFVEHTGVRRSERFHDAIAWQRIQPKAFREHARIFNQLRRGAPATAPQPWCHPVFEALLKRASAKEE